MLSTRHIERLRQIVGPDGLVEDEGEMAGYAIAARYGSGRPAAVLRPRTSEAASQAVAYCVAADLDFLPQGGNTGLVLGSTPDDTGRQVIISCDRLTGVLDIDPLDRMVTLSAGVRLSALNAALAPHGLFLPIDLGADPMVGGMAATNAAGARYLRYGDMRRHVLALETVLPRPGGPRVRLGRGLRKDNSALPLRDLWVGSCGTLGLITELTLEVARRPAGTAAALLIPRPGAELELLAQVEAATGGSLAAFEGMSGAAVRCALSHVPSLRSPFPAGAVPDFSMLVEIADHRSAGQLEAHLQDLLAQIAEGPATPLLDAFFGAPQPLWALRHALSEGLRASGPIIGFDLSFRRSRVFAFRDAAAVIIRRDFPQFEVCDFGHLADGGVHFNLLWRAAGGPPPSEAARLRDAVLSLAVDEFAGSYSGEHGLGRANQAAYDRYVPTTVRELSTGIAAVCRVRPSAAFDLSGGPLGSTSLHGEKNL